MLSLDSAKLWFLIISVENFPTFPAVSTNMSAEKRPNRNLHLLICAGQTDLRADTWERFMDSDIMADLTGGCRQIHKQSLALYLKQRTLAGLMYNLHVHSISRLLCCQLSCRLYLHALCTWEIWDVAQLSICAPVVVATGCLVYLPWFACQHFNKNHQIMSHALFFARL